MTASRCIVRVLGPVEVVIDNNVQPLRPMARRLLAVLAASPGRVVRVERLIDDLWPENQPISVEKTLQTHVVHLRRAMGSSAVFYRAAGYVLNLDVVSLDALDLERQVTLAEHAVRSNQYEDGWALLEGATELLRGVPFDEFAVDEFAAAEVARLSELEWRSVELSADCAARIGRAESMVGALERLVLEQPLRESAWSSLIGVLVASGRSADARRAAERAKAVLAREFNSGPGPQLEHVIAAIPAQPVAKRSSGYLPRSLEALRLDTHVGRGEEQCAIDAFLQAPTERNGLIVVTGEPGIGKTSLLAMVATTFADAGGVVMFGRCHEERSSLGAVTDLLSGHGDDMFDLDRVGLHPLGRSALLRCVNPHGSSDQPLRLADESLERDHLHAAIVDVFRSVAHGRRLLVILDDVHWADAETMDVAAHLLGRKWESGFAIIFAARDESGRWQELAANSIERGSCVSVPLLGLQRDDVAALVSHCFGALVADDITDEIHRQTDGNPLLVTAVTEDRVPRHDPSLGHIPSRISLLVAGRLTRLDPLTRSVVQAAAVAGTSCSAPLLASVLALDDHIVNRSIASAQAHHLLTLDTEVAPTARFVHDLFRQAVYQSLAFDLRTELHESFALFFRDRIGSVDAAAKHWQSAGRPLEAAKSFLAKARRERALLQQNSALRSTLLGLELATGNDQMNDDVAIDLVSELQYLKVALLIDTGQPDEAIAAIQQARRTVRRGTFAYVRLERLAAKMDAHRQRYKEATERLRHCLRETAYLGGPEASIEIGSEWCDIQIDLAWMRYRNGDTDYRRDEDVQQTFDHVTELGSARQRADLDQVSAALENQRSRFASSERALRLAHRSLLASMEIDDPILIADKTFSVGFQLLWLRRIDEAEARFRTAVALYTDIGADTRTLIPLVYLTVASRLRGDVPLACQRAQTALEMAERGQSDLYAAVCRANLGWCAWRKHDLETARQQLSRALTTFSHELSRVYPLQGLALWPALALVLRLGEFPIPATELATRLIDPLQQGLPGEIEGALVAGHFREAVNWAVERNLA
jgi:DNA-binding SARP family transcriptional activator/tetratricopeptide (TPR) repeat protein